MTVVEASVQAGEGTHLAIHIASAFVDVAQCYEIDGPEVLVEAIDKTALTSTLIITRPSKQPEPGKVTFKLWFDPSDTDTQQLLYSRATTPGTVDQFQLTFNDQYTTHALGTFHGFVTSFKMNGMKMKSNLGADLEVQMTDLPAFTGGTTP